MAKNQGPFPVQRLAGAQAQPGNVKDRTYHSNGVDATVGPSYSERRANTDTIRVSGSPKKDVRRFGVATGQRGEWKR